MKSKGTFICFAILLLFAFIPGNLFSQSEEFQFSIADEKTKKPIQFCYVVVKGKNISSISDENGFVKIKASPQDTLVIYQLGYLLKKIPINGIHPSDNLVFLKTKKIDLDEVTITSKKMEIFQEKNHTVFLDFEFYDDLVLSLVNKGGKYNALQLSDRDGNRMLETTLTIKSEKLYKDCLDNIHLLSEDSIYQIYYDYQTIKLLPPYDLENYYSILQHCECSHGDKYIFKIKRHQKLKDIYSYYDLTRGVHKPLICVADSENIRDFNMEFDIHYFLGERWKGRGYRYSVTELKKHLDLFRENLQLPYNYAILLAPVESEIKKLDTNFVLFDYTHKMVYHYSLNGTLQYQSPLHNFSSVSPRLCLDRDANNYVFFNLNNKTGILTLYRYDKSKNSLTHKFILNDFYYIRNFKIKENYLYFINRVRTRDAVKTKIVKAGIYWEKM